MRSVALKIFMIVETGSRGDERGRARVERNLCMAQILDQIGLSDGVAYPQIRQAVLLLKLRSTITFRPAAT